VVNDGGFRHPRAKHYTQPSAFTPENLLREARRQRRIADSSIPDVCVLDPDGDIVRSLLARGEARLESGWACYHTQLYSFSRAGLFRNCRLRCRRPVRGADREEIVRIGLQLLISVTSPDRSCRYARRLISYHRTRAARRSTSYHYIAASDYSHADAGLISALSGAFPDFRCRC